MPVNRRKCWSCSNVAEHRDNYGQHIVCTQCRSRDTRLVKMPEQPPVLRDPTPLQVWSACVSFRHDFGLLSPEDRASIELTAIEWLRAWQHQGVI